MNRKEAKNSAIAWVIESVSVYYAREKVEESIDEIYDDFESRTCENCEFFPNDIDCMVDFMGEQPPKRFGCINFERMSDDNTKR